MNCRTFSQNPHMWGKATTTTTRTKWNQKQTQILFILPVGYDLFQMIRQHLASNIESVTHRTISSHIPNLSHSFRLLLLF